jgi:hypothetical protein
MQDTIMRAMEQADNLMNVGAQLKTHGVKYEFNLIDGAPAHYIIKAGDIKYLICMPQYADDDAVIVNGLALESN